MRTRTLLAAVAVLLTMAPGCGKASPGQLESSEYNGTPSTGAPAQAPEFPDGLSWFNVEGPPSLSQLRGKVVLLDFWTLGCVNCQQVIPDEQRLEEEFSDSLVIIGVHSGKYSAERDDDLILDAIHRFGLAHPVVNDSEFRIWDSYGVKAWPTLVLLDTSGQVIARHEGEGVYDFFAPKIASSAEQARRQGTLDTAPLPLAPGRRLAESILSFPAGLAVDVASQRLFISDSGHNRIIVSGLDGRVEAVVGTGAPGDRDGEATESEFRLPHGLALAEDGDVLYVADTGNHAIRAINLQTLQVRTVAGAGSPHPGPPLPRGTYPVAATPLASPTAAVQMGDRLYVAMAGVHQIWALDLEAQTVSPFVGTGEEGVRDGIRASDGPVTPLGQTSDGQSVATLAQPSGLASDGRMLYWVDAESSAVRRVSLSGTGIVETMAGQGLFVFGDRDGPGEYALLQHPQGVAVADDRLLVADTYNNKLKSVDIGTWAVTTLAGTGQRDAVDGPLATSSFAGPTAVAVGGGKAYVADASGLVRVVDLAGGTVDSMRFSNLDLLTDQRDGSTVHVALAGQEVAPGRSEVRIRISAPGGYHLNALAPSRLTFAASDTTVAVFETGSVSWSTGESQVVLSVPAQFRPGAATLNAAGVVYYCRTGAEAVCLIHRVEITMPVRVGDGAPGPAVTVEYALPPG